MEWLAVIPIIIVAAWALGSPNEATREWRAKARYMRWESTRGVADSDKQTKSH